MYTIIETKTVPNYETIMYRVKIAVDTAEDIPVPLDEWAVGSEMEVYENGGSRYKLGTDGEWHPVNFKKGSGGGDNSEVADQVNQNTSSISLLTGRVSRIETNIGGHTVKSDVPENAVFTDTVYDDSEVREDINQNKTDILNVDKKVGLGEVPNYSITKLTDDFEYIMSTSAFTDILPVVEFDTTVIDRITFDVTTLKTGGGGSLIIGITPINIPLFKDDVELNNIQIVNMGWNNSQSIDFDCTALKGWYRLYVTGGGSSSGMKLTIKNLLKYTGTTETENVLQCVDFLRETQYECNSKLYYDLGSITTIAFNIPYYINAGGGGSGAGRDHVLYTFDTTEYSKIELNLELTSISSATVSLRSVTSGNITTTVNVLDSISTDIGVVQIDTKNLEGMYDIIINATGSKYQCTGIYGYRKPLSIVDTIKYLYSLITG